MTDEIKYFGVLLLVVMVPITCIVGWNTWKNHIHGNMQFIDLKTKFNVAYILGDDGKFERRRIRAWKDWGDSDAVQVVLEDGTPIYTHLRNVKLSLEADQ